jgi:hypothetical protein
MRLQTLERVFDVLLKCGFEDVLRLSLDKLFERLAAALDTERIIIVENDFRPGPVY